MNKLHEALSDFIDVTNDLRQKLRDAGADDNGVLNFFAQAYAIAGIETETDPNTLVRILAIHSVGLSHMIEDPDISEEDLRGRLRSDLRLTEHELDAALRCQSEEDAMPMVVSAVTGEA